MEVLHNTIKAGNEGDSMGEIPVLTTKEASKILRRGENKCWILRKNEDGEFRISVKSDHAFKQIRLYEGENKRFSRKPDDSKVSLSSVIDSLLSEGILGERIQKSMWKL